jgi:flagellar protein FlaJ
MSVSSPSSPKPISKASFSELLQGLFKKDQFREVYNSQLFQQLTYMSAVAAAGISRSRIFQMAGELPLTPSAYFSRVHLLSQKLGYDYASACSMVGLSIKSEAMISLLLRLGTALGSGQPEKDFLEQEMLVQGKAYEKEYETDLSSLTKWTDAYAAVTVSATLIVIINMTSSLIYPLSDGMLFGLVGTAAVTAGASAWILSRAAPKEEIDLFSKEGPWLQRMALKLVYLLVPAVFIVCAPLLALGVHVGWVTLIAATLLLPLGVISVLAGRQIDKKDREFGPFLRSLGSMAVSAGTTLAEALTRVDISSYPTLAQDLARLRSRLAAAIEPELCWYKFAQETGSKLIVDTVKIFHDAVRLGGDPDVVGFLAADFSARTIMLRAKRKVTASTFVWLTVVMHGVIAFLMMLIQEIVHSFVEMLSAATATLDKEALSSYASALPTFNAPQVEFFRYMAIGMVLLMAVINALAIGSTDGGHKLKLAFYFSLMFYMSGAAFLLAAPVVKGLFQA